MRSQVLESNSWIFYRAKYDCCTKNDCGGAHLPLLLAQLTDVDEVDTQDPDTRLEIKCWTPADACYDGDWVKWKERQKQLISTVSVAEVALTKVYFTTKKEKKGGKRMLALAIRTQLRGHSQSKYAEFGADPRPRPVRGDGKGKGKRPMQQEEPDEEESEEEQQGGSGEESDCSTPGSPGVAAAGSPLRRR